MPAGVAKTVLEGRNPDVQDLPPLVEVAKPMFEAPPSKNRPTWNAETIVDPEANVSGSTSVLCWLDVFVYGSLLNSSSWLLAWAGALATSHTSTARPKAPTSRNRPCLPIPITHPL